MALPDLTNQFAADSYKGILHTSNVSVSGANLPPVYDGLGYKSSLSLGSDGNGASFTGTLSADSFTVRGYATIIDYLYPIGAVYLDTIDVNPQTRFTGTSWSKISEGKFLAGVGTGTDKNSISQALLAGDDVALGEYVHTLTVEELAAHTHSYSNPVDQTQPNTEGVGAGTTLPYVSTSVRVVPNSEATVSTGNDTAHNNTPPYFGVYIWKRTA